jgi:transcriptional regulator with XRE-family HTH domain
MQGREEAFMLGNKRVMGNNIQYYMDKMNIGRKEFPDAIGVPYSSLTDWINGKTYPRIDKIEKMAKYFGVTKADLVEERTEKPAYYLNPETARVAQEIFDDPNKRILFDAAENATPDQLQKAAKYIEFLKWRDTDNDDPA